MILRCIVGHIVRELAGVLTLSMLVAVAQDVAVSLGELLHAGSLQPGQGIYVTDAAGRRLKGTLSDVSSAGLVVTHGGQAWTVAVADVRRIERQDPLANGCYGMTSCQHSCVRQHLWPLSAGLRRPSAQEWAAETTNDRRALRRRVTLLFGDYHGCP